MECKSGMLIFARTFVPPVNETGVAFFFFLQKSRRKAKTLPVILKHSEL